MARLRKLSPKTNIKINNDNSSTQTKNTLDQKNTDKVDKLHKYTDKGSTICRETKQRSTWKIQENKFYHSRRFNA